MRGAFPRGASASVRAGARTQARALDARTYTRARRDEDDPCGGKGGEGWRRMLWWGGGRPRRLDLGYEALEHDEVEPGGGGAEGPVPVDDAVEAAAPERQGAELADGEGRGLRPLLTVRLVAVPVVVVVAALPAAVGGVDEGAEEGGADDVGALAGEEGVVRHIVHEDEDAGSGAPCEREESREGPDALSRNAA